jgi:hypothetical protein
MHNATLISLRNVRATAFDLDVAESAMWLASKTDSVVEAVVGALAGHWRPSKRRTAEMSGEELDAIIEGHVRELTRE